MKMVGESQEQNFCNRSLKMKNIKLGVGEAIYRDFLLLTLEGQMHSFFSDGVEDVKTRHSINLFLQSETTVSGECKKYLARIEFTKCAVDHKEKSWILLDLINKSLPGFPGEVR